MSALALLAATIVSLNGPWTLKGWPTPGDGAVRTLAEAEAVPATAAGTERVGGVVSLPAVVPGSYELDLQRAGVLPDLLKGANHLAVRRWESHQWLYARTFRTPKVAKDERVFLEFDGLDTLCDVFLNGTKVGSAKNMYIPHEFDVKRALRPEGEENELKVLFYSPTMESQREEIAAIGNANSSCELEAFRKPSHMIGWDIQARMISAGIFRDVRLNVRAPERIRDAFMIMRGFDPQKRRADYLLDLRLEGRFERLDSSKVTLTLARKGRVVGTWSQPVYNWAPRLWCGISNADLWWPRGFGEPALYDAKVTWTDSANGAVFAEKTFRLGVKKVDFELSDFVDADHPGEMKFIVNGKPCFIRGTSWVPVDSLYARQKDRILPTLELIRDANCNAIRVWGGGLYEPEPFWDFCDENGIMVWQDCCFACTMYPQNNTALQEELRREIRTVAKRLRQHASMTLWCGNNENDSVFAQGPWRFWGADPNQDVFSRTLIPNVLREVDPTHPYLPSSPFVNRDVVAKKARSVEGHYYRRWWKGELFTKTHEKFYSEIGLHGCPSVESIREMFDASSWYPWTSPAASNVMWKTRYVDYTPGDYLSNELVPGEPPRGIFDFNREWTLKCILPFAAQAAGRSKYTGCRNHRMILQAHMLFGAIETSLEGFALQSQCAQAEGMKFFVEHFRSRKFAKKTGMTWWNMRDGWPIISDAVVDYYGRKKLAYDYIRRAQQNVLVMVDEQEKGEHALLVVNDLLRNVKGHATLTDAASSRTLFDGDFACGENAVARFGALRLEGQGVVKIAYTVEGDAASYHSHYLYGGPTSKYVGEKKIAFADYCRWMGYRPNAAPVAASAGGVR